MYRTELINYRETLIKYINCANISIKIEMKNKNFTLFINKLPERNCSLISIVKFFEEKENGEFEKDINLMTGEGRYLICIGLKEVLYKLSINRDYLKKYIKENGSINLSIDLFTVDTKNIKTIEY